MTPDYLHTITISAGSGGGGGGGGICMLNPEDSGYWDDPNCNASPIIVDIANNGYQLTNVADGVLFDLNADGKPEHVAWTQPNSDDAFLAMDRNDNGVIDDGSELFGNATPAYRDHREPPAANGFDALKFAEGPSYGRSKPDLIIDQQDAVFGRLLLWQDVNHNGYSEPEELQPIEESKLVAIETECTESRYRDDYGNEFRLRAKAWWARSGGLVPLYVYDVWLKWSR